MATPLNTHPKCTIDANDDDVLCYELIKLIHSFGTAPMTARHIFAMMAVPFPDMRAVWCPHAAIYRELNAIPDGCTVIPAKVSNLPALDSWIKRYGEGHNARLMRSTGKVHLGYDALLLIALTVKHAVEDGKFPGSRMLTFAKRDSAQFPKRLENIGRKRNRKPGKAAPTEFTPEQKDLMKEHLSEIMKDTRRYHDITRNRARDLYTKPNVSGVKFLTSQSSARKPPHKDTEFKRFAERLGQELLGRGLDTLAVQAAINAEFMTPETFDLSPVHRALDYGMIAHCADWVENIGPSKLKRRRINRHLAKLTPTELKKRDDRVALLSTFAWPEDSGLRAHVYRAAAVQINESGKPWFSLSKVALRLGKKADGMTLSHPNGILEPVPTAPPVCLVLTPYDVRYAYCRYFLETSPLFAQDTPVRFRYLHRSVEQLLNFDAESVDNHDY